MNAVDERPWPQEPHEAPVPLSPAVPPQAPPNLLRKKPLLALVLSAFPGLGQIYDGLYLRGLILFLIFSGLITLADATDHPLFIMGVFFTVLFSMVDAYRQALLINYGYAQDLGLSDLPARPRAGQGGLIAGVILTLIGVVALLERFFFIDLELLADLWPVGLIAVGVWLIVATVRERARDRARQDEA
jgi:hypothetical protein